MVNDEPRHKWGWYVYILECSDGSFYTGITTDPRRRLKAHNDGVGAKYTRARLPVVLKALRAVEDRSKAAKLEAFVKRQKKCKKLASLWDNDIDTVGANEESSNEL
jgi:putative endonuclease